MAFLTLTIALTAVASSLELDLKSYVKTKESEKQIILRGEGKWLQLTSSLRFVSNGIFWGENSTTISRAKDLKARDPLSAILDFNFKLEENNIDLILVSALYILMMEILEQKYQVF